MAGLAYADEAGVEVLRWPADHLLRAQLARSGVPRLLLVSAGERPPESLAPEEAWVQAPADGPELEATVRRLADSVARFDADCPWVDTAQVAHRGEVSVALSASEAAVAAALLERPGRVVTRAELDRVLRADGSRSGRALEAVIYRLRHRLQALHIVIRTVRSRGFAIDVAPAYGRAADNNSLRSVRPATRATPT